MGILPGVLSNRTFAGKKVKIQKKDQNTIVIKETNVGETYEIEL